MSQGVDGCMVSADDGSIGLWTKEWMDRLADEFIDWCFNEPVSTDVLLGGRIDGSMRRIGLWASGFDKRLMSIYADGWIRPLIHESRGLRLHVRKVGWEAGALDRWVHGVSHFLNRSHPRVYGLTGIRAHKWKDSQGDASVSECIRGVICVRWGSATDRQVHRFNGSWAKDPCPQAFNCVCILSCAQGSVDRRIDWRVHSCMDAGSVAVSNHWCIHESIMLSIAILHRVLASLFSALVWLLYLYFSFHQKRLLKLSSLVSRIVPQLLCDMENGKYYPFLRGFDRII